MIDLEKLQQSLTDEQIIEIVERLGADRYEEKDGYIIFPTICHNEYSEEASLKLYYYKDSKIFVCYTECDETFNIYSLIDKRFKLLGKNRVDNYEEKKEEEDYTFYDIILFILKSTTINVENEKKYSYKRINKKYHKKEDPFLFYFDKKILNLFTKYYPVEWIQEGISQDTMKKFDISYSISRNQIVIPHFSFDGNLIGIRGRLLNPLEIESYGKYRPLEIEGKSYAHPLSLNLYGLNLVKEGIAKSHKVIIFEGEKSVMKSYEFYGENSIGVASCGSHINKKQINLLIKNFDLNEIIIAFDKEYETQQEIVNYILKMKNMCQRYSNYCNFSFIVDKHNLLELKDAPIDKGQDIFEQLLKERIRVI